MTHRAQPNPDLIRSPARQVGLSLVIPAYNEEAVITQALQEAVTALTALTSTYEIIVVDDGSTDHTAALVRDFAARKPQVRLLQQPRNMGYGAALRAGFQSAQLELVSFTDADCQFHLEDLDYLVELAQRFDVVSGYRIDRQDPVLRRFCSWGYNTLVQLLMGSPVRDIDCALKVFRRSALLKILPETSEFFANTEMFSKARELNLRIVDVGVRHRSRAAGESKVRMTDVPRTLDALLPYWWRLHFAGADSPDENATHPGWTWLAGFVVMAIACVVFFGKLSYPLIEPDEGRYAEIMREMAATGDWVVPKLHQQAYLDKPPLFYWCGALSVRLFGPQAWAVRLVPALAGWLTVLMTFLCGRRLLGTPSAFLGSLVLTLSVGFALCGRYVILDSLLSMFVTASLLSGALALTGEQRGGKVWWLLSAVFCGLGMLTKGPVAVVLVIPPLFAHCWLRRMPQTWNLRPWLAFGVIVAAINVPWYIAMMQSVPEFSGHFFWEHNVARFLTGSNHPAPTWFYLPILFLSWMPWGLLLFPLMGFLASRDETRRSERPAAVGLLALSIIWCVGFFSISSGKLPTYIVPCFPAIALLIGHYLQCTHSPFAIGERLRKVQQLFGQGALYLALAGVAFPTVMWQLGLESKAFAAGHTAVWIGVALVVVLIRNRLAPKMIWGGFCLMAFAATLEATHHLFPAWAVQRSVLIPDSLLAGEMEDPSRPVACVQQSPGSVPFYLNRDDIRLLSYNTPDEITEFAEQPAMGFLIVDESVDELRLRDSLPAGRDLLELSESYQGSIYRIIDKVVTPDVDENALTPPVVKVAHDKPTKAVQ